MKKLIQHGKFWLIASAFSFGSYLFLQLDVNRPSHLETKHSLTFNDNKLNDEDEQTRLLDFDVIKSASQFVFDVFQLNF